MMIGNKYSNWVISNDHGYENFAAIIMGIMLKFFISNGFVGS